MSGLVAPQMSARETAAAVAARRISAEKRVRHALRRMQEVQPVLNPFTVILADEATETARALDRALAAGAPPGPLCGVPVAIKDFTPSAGHPATRGSWAISDAPGTHDPVIVRRLKAAGAIIVGKTTTPEFAYSSFTQSPRWGVTRNPHDPARSCGGSSGGAAAAVASGCVPLAEGTDMGGSIRIPAALSGVVGLKPGLGRIPMDILPTVFDDMSHFGPLALTVEDAALFLRAVEGQDPADILSRPPEAAPAPPPGLRGKRFAYSLDLGYYAIAPEVAQATEAAIARIRAAGAEVVPVTLPWSRRLNDLWSELWSVALAAAWGDLLPEYRGRMDPDLVALIEAADGMGAIRYKRLEYERSRFWHDFAQVMSGMDGFLCPTCAKPAPLVADRDRQHDVSLPDGRYDGLDMTCPFNLFAPCPAISLPLATPGLPVGLQLATHPYHDTALLALARDLEPVVGSAPARPANGAANARRD